MNINSDRWRKFFQPPLQTHVEVPDHDTHPDFPEHGWILVYRDQVGKFVPIKPPLDMESYPLAIDGSYLVWDVAQQEFTVAQNEEDISWGFQSPAAATGITYVGGFYEFGASDDDFAIAATHGTADAAKSAYFFVVLGALAVDEITLTVTGDSITDAGVLVLADTEDIIIPDGSVADTYFQTTKKWVGQVSVVVSAGTATTCNYGFVKYWDNEGVDYILNDFDITWYGGASDGSPEIMLYHHQQTGWTYNVGSTPTPPTPLAIMSDDLGTNIEVVLAEHGAYKRAGIDEEINADSGEGILFAVTNSVAAAFLYGTIQTRYTRKL